MLCMGLLLTPVGAPEALFTNARVVAIEKGQFGPRGMPGDIEVLGDGSLLLCYTRDGIMSRTSTDGGRTWSDEAVLVPNPSAPSTQGYYCHPSFVRLANGDLMLSYIYGSAAVPYYGHNYYRRSADDGRTWSEQFMMTPCPGYVIVHNDKITRLDSGRIIAAAERKKRWPDSNDHGGYVACAFYSDDNAYSWHMCANEVDMDPMEAQEAHIEELKDGRLLMVFRTYNGFLGRAFSTDQGASWSAGELVKELPISANACAVTVKRIPSTGDLLLIRTTAGQGGRRTPLVSVISKDEGETWESPRELASDPEDDYGYQSVTFLQSEDVCVVSYHARDGLHVARVRTEWFYGE